MLQLTGLTKTYRTEDVETTALDAVDLSIAAGEFVAVMGPSGCGKSTLLNLVGMLDTPTRGQYVFEGTDISGYSERQRAELSKRRLGFIFQSFNLIDDLRCARTSSWRFCTSASMAASAPPASTRSWTGSASPIARAIVRRSCRAASSSAWRWRGRWWAGRR